MNQLQIRELQPDDAEVLIAYTKQIGGESDNLTFGADGFPVTVEKESEILQSMIDDPHSVMFGVWRGNDLIVASPNRSEDLIGINHFFCKTPITPSFTTKRLIAFKC